jgi:uncharacterized membrane protein YhaH (DUF805 family)
MEWISYVLFAFNGRINRVTWLAFFAALAIAEFVSGAYLHEVSSMPAPVGAGSSPEAYFDDRASFLAGLIFLWPSVAVDVKRWHDIGRSGWFALIVYAPALGIYAAEELKHAGVLPDAPLPGALISLMGLVFLVYIILLAARKGSRGANRFGPAA